MTVMKQLVVNYFLKSKQYFNLVNNWCQYFYGSGSLTIKLGIGATLSFFAYLPLFVKQNKSFYYLITLVTCYCYGN